MAYFDVATIQSFDRLDRLWHGFMKPDLRIAFKDFHAIANATSGSSVVSTASNVQPSTE